MTNNSAVELVNSEVKNRCTPVATTRHRQLMEGIPKRSFI